MRGQRPIALLLSAGAACSSPYRAASAPDASLESAPTDPATGDGDDASSDAAVDTRIIGTKGLWAEPPLADPGAHIDLTAEGRLDWIERHDSSTSGTRCSQCAPLFSPIDFSSSSFLRDYGDDSRTWTWSNGSPTTAGAMSGAISVNRAGASFTLTVFALTPGPMLLTLYVASAGATIDASLFATTVPPLSVALPTAASRTPYAVRIHIAPPTASKLTVALLDPSDADLSFSAATLAPDP